MATEPDLSLLWENPSKLITCKCNARHGSEAPGPAKSYC